MAQDPARTADRWKRQSIPNAKLSIELPGPLTLQKRTDVKDEADWVKRFTDYAFENDEFIVTATLFEGRGEQKVDKKFLTKVMEQFVGGAADGLKNAKRLHLNEDPLSKRPALRALYQIGKGAEKFYLRLGLVGDGSSVAVVMAVYFAEKGSPAQSAERVIKSLKAVTRG